MSVLAPVELTAALFEWSIFVLLVLVGVALLRKYAESENKDVLILAICIIIFAIAPICQSLDIFILDRIPSTAEAAFGYRLAYLMSGYANIFLALFFLRIYREENVNLITGLYAVANIVNTSLIVHSGFLILADPMYPIIHLVNKTILRHTGQQLAFNAEAFQTLYMVIHLILALSLYIFMIQAAIKSSKKDISLKAQRGFQLIALFGLFLVLTFVFFIFDFLSQLLVGAWYSIWTFVGWTCAGIGAFMAYLAYVMPNWLKQRWAIPDDS